MMALDLVTNQEKIKAMPEANFQDIHLTISRSFED